MSACKRGCRVLKRIDGELVCMVCGRIEGKN
jgi:hypothetical protein